jgi:hypothetical protein
MGRFWGLLPSGRPRDAACARRRKYRPPQVCPLEARELTTLTGISLVTASTQVLTPPNGRFVPITLSGQVANDRLPAPTAQVHVIDEYRRVNSARPIPLTAMGKFSGSNLYTYSFTVRLEASRSDQDLAGRQYYVIITFKDRNTGGARIVPVIVPHDPRHIPQPNAGIDSAAARTLRDGSRPRMLTPGSGRPTGRRGGPR